eukprot:1156796-Pelagomonas_calceolata.AAC.2
MRKQTCDAGWMKQQRCPDVLAWEGQRTCSDLYRRRPDDGHAEHHQAIQKGCKHGRPTVAHAAQPTET